MINMLMMNTVLIDRIFTQSADDELTADDYHADEQSADDYLADDELVCIHNSTVIDECSQDSTLFWSTKLLLRVLVVNWCR